MVLYLESPPPTGCDARFKSFDVWAGLATRSVQSAAREVGSQQGAGGRSLRLEAGQAPGQLLRRALAAMRPAGTMRRLLPAQTGDRLRPAP
eukprot:scaffold17015_cov51-Phaeocystis_antarctica.AAC.1